MKARWLLARVKRSADGCSSGPKACIGSCKCSSGNSLRALTIYQSRPLLYVCSASEASSLFLSLFRVPYAIYLASDICSIWRSGQRTRLKHQREFVSGGGQSASKNKVHFGLRYMRLFKFPVPVRTIIIIMCVYCVSSSSSGDLAIRYSYW